MGIVNRRERRCSAGRSGRSARNVAKRKAKRRRAGGRRRRRSRLEQAPRSSAALAAAPARLLLFWRKKGRTTRPPPRERARGSFFRRSIAELVPYEPGKPVEEVQRELGLERVVKLASNEGPFGPFPAALEALERSARELNRYPTAARTRCARRSPSATASRFEEVAIGAGADGVIDCLEPGRARRGRRDRLRLAVVPELRARRDQARRACRCAFRCATTATTSTRCSRRSRRARSSSTSATRTTRRGRRTPAPSWTRYLDHVPGHVLTVLDQAYFEYIDDPDYADGVEEYFKPGAASSSCARSRRSTGSRGCASATASRPRTSSPRSARYGVRSTSRRRRRPPRSRASATSGARAPAGAVRRGAARASSELLRGAGFDVAGPAVANFVYAETGGDARALFDALLREGVIVRPLGALRAPSGDPRHRRNGRRERRSRGGARTGSAPPRRTSASRPWAAVELLRRNRSFRLLFLATLGSLLGTWLATIALTVDVYDRTHSGTWVARAPDRRLPADGPRRRRARAAARPAVAARLMIASDLLRAGVFVALPFVDRTVWIVALAAVERPRHAIYRPAVNAGMPNLLEEDDLEQGNALFMTVENMAWAAGPLVGGVIVAASGPTPPTGSTRCRSSSPRCSSG